MMNLKVDFENCFGIGKLKHEFDFSTNNTFLIYAPNGTMKTSFALTFDLIAKNDIKNMPRDRVYGEKESKYEILSDDKQIDSASILVINAEDNTYDASSKISTFLASQALKKKYDDIYVDLNERKNNLIKDLKNVSRSNDCETELINAFNDGENLSFFEILLNQKDNLEESLEKPSFRYNDVFDTKGNVKKFLDKNEGILDQYTTSYREVITKSKFFKESENTTFGTYQANVILKSIEDNSFFDAGHKFVLEDGTEIDDSKVLNKLIQEELQSILSDDKLKKAFEKVDKAISANADLRAFQKVIEKNNFLLIKLKDYELFKKEVWIACLSELKQEVLNLVNYYQEKKEELDKIIHEAKEEFDLWKTIIRTFNSRFYVPFEVLLTNQEDIVLKQGTANLEFIYADKNEKGVKQNKDSLLDVLSKGEQRAYFILQFLFEIESRKTDSERSLLIFDDIADSFDYKNKYAIIEYIRDLSHSEKFNIIILTHNFDFYRTVTSRLALNRKRNVHMATKSAGRIVKLHQGEYVNNILDTFLNKLQDPKVFISLIPFLRNLIEFSDSISSDEYKLLTCCLHLKEGTATMKTNDIFELYQQRFSKQSVNEHLFPDRNLFEFIMETADSICEDASINEVLLENKITLSIAIRLKAEKYMINNLPDFDDSKVRSNQTQYLYGVYKKKFDSSRAIPFLDKVNLMTPENIHINAFMYEPLIDMSVHHLIELYKEVSNLLDSSPIPFTIEVTAIKTET